MVDMLGAFQNRTPQNAPIVIVTADHGEALGDHGQPYHSTDLYNSQIHVPFVVAGPGIKPGRIAETVSLTDLTPTVLELAGFVPPQGRDIDGRSLADMLWGKRAPDPQGGVAFAAMIRDRSNPGGLSAVVDGPWKLIEGKGKSEVYDIAKDPREQNNLVLSRAPMIDKLRSLLRDFQTRSTESPFF
jgi:arylsulfatase A-like enzyme